MTQIFVEYPQIHRYPLGFVIDSRSPNYRDMYLEKYSLRHAIRERQVAYDAYTNAYNAYAKVAVERAIDLFVCDANLPDACVDAAWTMKKPVVMIGSSFES
ncbi:7744_t:CDS:1, partial [Paraglomus occultum]